LRGSGGAAARKILKCLENHAILQDKEAVTVLNKKFKIFREKYPVFFYDGFKLSQKKGFIQIVFDFAIDGLCEFHPKIEIKTDNLTILNRFDSARARAVIFSLGLTEAVSYWKCACPPRFVVRCGALSGEDKLWWKKLWFNGLSEFFYRNRIETDFENFVVIENDAEYGGSASLSDMPGSGENFHPGGLNIIPVGGGKDSCVTLELLRERCENNLCFTVNDQPARTQTAAVAGCGDDHIIKTYREIDKQLLQRNAEGFLNGHTPFSAIVAFLSYYCAYITGAENIILSNESSANEANIEGTEINHQYSKSYGFESDFNEYASRNFGENIRYFSLLRAFNELQIAKEFAALKQYHSVFRSCNAGSKKNIWCCSCAKCLFVYIILSPFLDKQELVRIFGCDMLEKEELREAFEGLIGLSNQKPFECIGTVSEVCCALEMTAKKYEEQSVSLPLLLDYYLSIPLAGCGRNPVEILGEINPCNNVPEEFRKYITEMYEYVSKAD